jgi:uncharacterized coiled-coil DUF342 family protein
VSSTELFTILGTAVTVAGAMAAAGRWALSMSIREDMQPLREAILGLKQTADQLSKELREAKVEQKEGRDELHDAVQAIRDVLANHDKRITVLESSPKPPARIRKVG